MLRQQRQGDLTVVRPLERLVAQFIAIAPAVKKGSGLLPATFDRRLQSLHIRIEGGQGALVFLHQQQRVCYQFVIWVRAALVVDPGAFAATCHQASLGQNTKMTRYAALPHAQNVDDLVHVQRGSSQQAQQAQARLVGESFVNLQEV